MEISISSIVRVMEIGWKKKKKLEHMIIQTIWMWQLIWYKNLPVTIVSLLKNLLNISWCCIFTKNSNHLFEISHTTVFDFAFSLQETPFPLNLAHLISVNVKWKNIELSKSHVVENLRNYMKNRKKRFNIRYDYIHISIYIPSMRDH